MPTQVRILDLPPRSETFRPLLTYSSQPELSRIVTRRAKLCAVRQPEFGARRGAPRTAVCLSKMQAFDRLPGDSRDQLKILVEGQDCQVGYFRDGRNQQVGN